MKWLATIACALLMTGCSLGRAIQFDADRYNATMSDHDLNVITTNILRSRDHLPLNFAQMSTITGSLSASASITGTFPYKPFGAGANGSNSWSPTLSVGSNPTFNMGSLSVQGFTLGLIQPISPLYVESKWRGDTSRELLLLLFVKEITVLKPCSAAQVVANTCDPATPGATTVAVTYRNDPDDPAAMAAYRDLVYELTQNENLDIKVTTVLEPVGPQFPYFVCPSLSASQTGQSPQPATGCAASDTTPQAFGGANRFDGLDLATAQADVQYHVGNAEQKDTKSNPENLSYRDGDYGQLYRVYANQVALCVNQNKATAAGLAVYPLQPPAPPQPPVGPEPPVARQPPVAPQPLGPLSFQNWEAGAAIVKALGGGHQGGGGAGGASPGGASAVQGAPGGGHGGAGAGGAGGGGASASSQVTTALQADRISAIITTADCKPDEIVMDAQSEKGYENQTEDFAHVRWRSIAEVVQYLGALARYDGQLNHEAWWAESTPANVVRVPITPSQTDAGCAGSLQLDKGYAQTTSTLSDCDVLFSMHRTPDPSPLGVLPVIYGGEVVFIPKFDPGRKDHSIEVLAMLSELINTVKNQADLPITPQLLIP